ncbi:nadp transhydrogenase, partial [Aphelenchoides avenae]
EPSPGSVQRRERRSPLHAGPCSAHHQQHQPPREVPHVTSVARHRRQGSAEGCRRRAPGTSLQRAGRLRSQGGLQRRASRGPDPGCHQQPGQEGRQGAHRGRSRSAGAVQRRGLPQGGCECSQPQRGFPVRRRFEGSRATRIGSGAFPTEVHADLLRPSGHQQADRGPTCATAAHRVRDGLHPAHFQGA